MKKIKSFLFAIIALSMVSACVDNRTEEQKKDESLTKQLVGQWVNPYTYESTGELKGYNFKKKGECRAINIPSWNFETWRVKKGWIIINGFEIDEKGNKISDTTKMKIARVTKDSLRIIATESPRSEFLYVNPKTLKK